MPSFIIFPLLVGSVSMLSLIFTSQFLTFIPVITKFLCNTKVHLMKYSVPKFTQILQQVSIKNYHLASHSSPNKIKNVMKIKYKV